MSENAIYARVSTEEQAKKNLSIPAQLAACREYAARQGFNEPIELTDDETGAILQRSGMDRLRELVKAGAIKRIIVWRQDRLARDELGYFTLRAEWKRHKVDVHVVQRGGKVDGLYASLEAVLDADERERIRDRTMQGRRMKAQRGQLSTGGPPPFGYIRQGAGETVHWTIDESIAPAIRQIFKWYTVDLCSISEIAVRLTEQSVPTPSDRREEVKRKKPPGHWNRETVSYILHNPAYTGTFYAYRIVQPKGDIPGKRPPPRFRDPSEWIPISVPAMIETSVFEAAQRRLETAVQLGYRNTKHAYLVGRRISCQCGYGATAGTSSLTGYNRKRYRYYTCNTHKRSRPKFQTACDTPSFRGDAVDARVWEWVRGEILTPENLRLRLDERTRMRAVAPVQDEREHLMREIADLEQQRERWNHAYILGTNTLEEYAPWKRHIDAQLADRKARLSSLTPPTEPPAQQATLQIIDTILREHQDTLDAALFPLQRFIIDHLDIRVTMRVVDGEKRLTIRSDALDLKTDLPLAS